VHDAVYERLKARLLERPLTPGRTLQIGPWAEELRVSSTPVREALTRCAAEGLILFAPRKGFFARTPTETEIRGLYAANVALVSAAIDHVVWPEKPEPWSALHGDALPIVLATDELFLRIGRHSGLSELSERIQNLSERLRHVRLIECEVLGEAEKELANLRSHVDLAQRVELRAAVGAYHETRIKNVSQICRELLVRAFASTGG
jgi:DNA-binding transcriptional MocR family regulator